MALVVVDVIAVFEVVMVVELGTESCCKCSVFSYILMFFFCLLVVVVGVVVVLMMEVFYLVWLCLS